MKLDIIYNEDCLEGMKKRFLDKSIPLILTDPPYGLNIASGGSVSIKGACRKKREFVPSDWDKFIPSKEYFEEMFRVSENQIIWGGNYFTDFFYPSQGWLVWYKKEGLISKSFADCELAWTSFQTPAKVISSRWHGFIRDSKEQRVAHPTQKALEVIKWCICEFSNEGDIILDPFMGSGTTAVACKQLNRRYIGFEISKEYCEIAKERLNKIQLELIN